MADLSSHCPPLGTLFDPTTHFFYPTEENACGSLRGPESLEPTHQEQFCLSGNYAACPYFEADPQTTRWSKMGQSGRLSSPPRRVNWLSLVGIVIVSAALLVAAGFLLTRGELATGFLAARASPTFVLPTTPKPSPTFNADTNPPPFVSLSLTPTASATQTALPTPTNAPTQTATPTTVPPSDTPTWTSTVPPPSSTLQPRRLPTAVTTGTAAPAARTPPPLIPKYAAPRLHSPADNETSRSGLEILAWQPVTDTLGANEEYAVEVWKEGTEPTGVGWTRDTYYELNAGADPVFGHGIYLWHVLVVQVEGDQLVAYLSEPSLTRRLIWYR